MPTFDQHCAEATAAFGAPFEEVHRWLDELAGRPPWGMRHRRFRHHAAGIEEVRQRWGDSAALVARQQIVADLRLDGWTPEDPFPRNEPDYVRMGLF
jgi:hypothetical protein